MDLIVPGNGLIIWQLLGILGVALCGYVAYLALKALRKYTAGK